MSTAQLMGAQIVAGFAVVESLLPWLDARLKWPNDLVYAGKKLAGLLIETQFAGNTLKKAIFGVGINIKAVNPALKERAIAIKDINSGADIDIHHFIESLSKQLDEKLELYLAGELDITSSWAQYSANYMKTISIHINGQKTGVVEAGITERGYLKTADGAIITDGEIGYDFGI
jgi:BirA family biotin operon repressor/biotin-[acetyl-CoA-carboxylase] ligase